MASTASIASLSHAAQVQYPPTCTTTTTTTRKTLNVFNTKRNDKLYKDFQFSSSASFPVNLNTTSSNPIQFYPLQDSVRNEFLENLENSTRFHVSSSESQQIVRDSVENIETCSDLCMPRSENHQLMCLEPRRRVFIQDPPWISSNFLKDLYKRIKQQEVKPKFKEMVKRKFNFLRRRQVKEETEAWERMVDEYKQLEARMIEKKLAPNLPRIKGLFLGWFEPLREAIAREQKVQRTKKLQAAYAPHIDLLPQHKMAVIVMHKMMRLVMAGHEYTWVQVVQAAVHIGMAIEQEVRIHRFLEKTKNYKRKKIVADTEEVMSKEREMLRKRVNSLIKSKRLIEVQKLLKNEENKPWGRDTQAKLGSRLLELLIETAYVQHPVDQAGDCPPDVRPTFRHRFKTITRHPGQKITKSYGVVECNLLVLAGLDRSALDALGNTKWRVNKKVLSVLESIWTSGGNVVGLVDHDDIPLPEKPVSEDLQKFKSGNGVQERQRKLTRRGILNDVILNLSSL